MAEPDRALNEHELGMMNVLLALTTAVMKLGADADELTADLRRFQKVSAEQGKPTAAAIPAIIANALDKARGKEI